MADKTAATVERPKAWKTFDESTIEERYRLLVEHLRRTVLRLDRQAERFKETGDRLLDGGLSRSKGHSSLARAGAIIQVRNSLQHTIKKHVKTLELDRCHAAKDGECSWEHCPQIRDNEPDRTGRHCPIDTQPEDIET